MGSSDANGRTSQPSYYAPASARPSALQRAPGPPRCTEFLRGKRGISALAKEMTD